ncbi:MAG: MMPL family transporter [Candidatus Thermoplasmatota archaeon]|nr:MMPL family transporter [Candidatus Thermoplasmatota archaeon]
MSDDSNQAEPPRKGNLLSDFTAGVQRRVAEFEAGKAMDAILSAPKLIRRELKEMSFFGALTRFPAFTVIACLVLTVFLALESGITDQYTGERSMNVNGDLAAFLPEGSQVADDISKVEDDWTTNVMIIYVESGEMNITNQTVLSQMDFIEQALNTHPSDQGVNDDIIYILSISSVVKEINSSAPRVANAFVSNVGKSTGLSNFTDEINQLINQNADLVGGYTIPEDQNRIDQIIGEIPDNARDKLVRDVGLVIDDQLVSEQSGYGWNRAVIIVGVAENDLNGDGVADTPISKLIEDTQGEIDRIAKENGWDNMSLTMTLTGPVPITNAVTEYTFALFWEIFPVGVVSVALVLFIFHCDVIQTGRVRWVQGIKVVIIAGLPTLCSVFATLGLIGLTNYEVTMTVIIVGPIILALGVSYGLHITNRYAESKGTPQEKMALALQSTGRAVFLSAITTVIGFVSLILTPMAPIKTVGVSLAGGIIIVYLFTMVMVPNLTMLLDLEKPSHPPPKVFVAAVRAPIKWNKVALAMFIILMLFSGLVSRTQVVEDVDLLSMAPQDEPAVSKMITYSEEFEAGQVGMLLVEANIEADPEFSDQDFSDPYENLYNIEVLAREANSVNRTTAVSIVFLMKAIGASLDVSGDIISSNCGALTDPGLEEACRILFDREFSNKGTFWDVLTALENTSTGGRETQSFLISVFYDSLTDETRHFFVSRDYQRSLIYIDMPFMPVKETEAAAAEINEYSKEMKSSDFESSALIGVAAVTIDVNNLIVGSQWQSLGFALLFTVITLGFVFRDAKYAILTTMPVVFTVAMQWFVMDMQDVTLSLVTVMIGSILVGVGVDFSIHIANRVRELGGDLEAIQDACASTGMSLFEATVVTSAGLMTAYLIPIPALKPFVTVIIILLTFAALSALILLPAIYTTFVKQGWGLSGGSQAMQRRAGLAGGSKAVAAKRDAAESYEAVLIGSADDAW